MVMSFIIDQLSWVALKECQMQLLTKDDIYLNDAPMSVEFIILAPGNPANDVYLS